MSKALIRVIGLGLLFTLTALVTTAQEDGEMTHYTDSLGRFNVIVPAGWDDLSTIEQAHFRSAAGTADIFATVIDVDSVQVGIQTAVEQIEVGFSAAPVQSNEVPLPNGRIWNQQVYLLPDGAIMAAVGRTVDGMTYVIAIRAPQAELATEAAALNDVLFSHTVNGEADVTQPVPDYVDETRYSVIETTVVSGEYQLPGTLTLPVGDGPYPAVVIVHGSGPNDRDGSLGPNKPYRDIAQGLASMGIAVLRYDKRTFVYREPVAGFTVDDEVTDDALAAVALVRGLDVVDPARVYVLGHSQGAMFAPRIAERDGNLAGIIMLAGTPYSFDQVLSSQIEYLRDQNPNADVGGLDVLVEILRSIRDGMDPSQAFGGDETQATYWASMMDYTPGETAETLEVPMLILQGARDYQTTMSDFAAWQERLAERESVRLIAYPTLNHVFMALGDVSRMAVPADYGQVGFVDSAVITDIADWIAK